MTHYYEETQEQKDAFWSWAVGEDQARAAVKAVLAARAAKRTAAGVMRCGRCMGSGWIRCFSHVAAGVCFACDGKGTVSGLDI